MIWWQLCDDHVEHAGLPPRMQPHPRRIIHHLHTVEASDPRLQPARLIIWTDSNIMGHMLNKHDNLLSAASTDLPTWMQ